MRKWCLKNVLFTSIKDRPRCISFCKHLQWKGDDILKIQYISWRSSECTDNQTSQNESVFLHHHSLMMDLKVRYKYLLIRRQTTGIIQETNRRQERHFLKSSDSKPKQKEPILSTPNSNVITFNITFDEHFL